jgi:hypothetical protein
MSCHDHDACGCSHESPQDSLRKDAEVVLRRADEFVGAGRLDEANTMLAAAETLLDAAGGHECDAGIWMFSTAAALAFSEGDLPEAEIRYRRTHQLSLTLQGEQHPRTAVALSNLAVVILRAGRTDEGTEMLKRSVEELRTAVPNGKYSQELIDSVIAEKSAVLERLASPAI